MSKNITYHLIAFCACAFYCTTTIKAQETVNAFAQQIRDQDFLFTAVNYASASGGNQQLTDFYYVKIKEDRIIGSLPYYGQNYSAQINLTDGGLKFNSIKFEYNPVEKKKGKILLKIRLKDDQIIVQELFLTIFSDGSAQMDVSSRNREPITLYGYISK